MDQSINQLISDRNIISNYIHNRINLVIFNQKQINAKHSLVPASQNKGSADFVCNDSDVWRQQISRG